MEEEIQVLIVDDSSVNRLVAKNMLSQFPLKLAEASSGEQAVEYIKKNHVDLIIIDLLMPGLNGIETTRLIRNQIVNGKQIKVIATSGQKIENLPSFLKENLLDDFLGKPLDIDSIERCLMQCFFLSRLQPLPQELEEQSDSWRKINMYFGSIKHMDLRQAIHVTNENSDFFLRLVLSSIPQLREVENVSASLLPQFNVKKTHHLLHSIKTVLFYLGATKLASQAECLDEECKKQMDNVSNGNCSIRSMKELEQFNQQISTLSDELEQAMNAYNNSIHKSQDTVRSQSCSKNEISHQIEILLSYVCQFEYVEITKGLTLLNEMVEQQLKEQMEVAMAAINEFDYETVKKILVSCWNEINEN